MKINRKNASYTYIFHIKMPVTDINYIQNIQFILLFLLRFDRKIGQEKHCNIWKEDKARENSELEILYILTLKILIKWPKI